jgi:flagellar biosynthetic protein FliO
MFNPWERLTANISNKKAFSIIFWGIVGLVFVFALWISGTSQWQTAGGEATVGGDVIPNTTALYINVLLKTMVVIALIYGAFALYRRFSGNLISLKENRMRVVETTQLSPRRTLYLVKVDDRQFLVGGTDQALNLLTEIERHDDVFETAPASENAIKDFAGLFQKSIKDAEDSVVETRQGSAH